MAGGWTLWRNFGSPPEKPPVSSHWQDGGFHNLPNPWVYKGLGNEPEYTGGWLKFLLSRGGDRYPPAPVQSVKRRLHALPDNCFVWLGHSSLLLKIGGKLICIDPVLSSHASPFPFIIPAWPGSTPYKASDFPVIDYLCISHDHWDHLDYTALASLKYRQILCGKGVSSYLAYWGVQAPVLELDWFEEFQTGDIRFIFTPSMHFSGRGLARNKTLWGGFIIDAGSGPKIYFSGDGGYGPHFREIGEKYGGFNLFFPDCGQYNRAWPAVHMFPELSAQAAMDVKAALACPVHMGKFTLSWHPWDEPIKRFAKKADENSLPYLHPVIGEVMELTAKA